MSAIVERPHRACLRCAAVLLLPVFIILCGLRLAAAPEEPDPDEKLLRDAKAATDTPGLLAFLRRQTLEDGDVAKLEALVRRLGDDSFEERETASKALVGYGRLAVPFLRGGAKDRDAEIARRSQDCLAEITAGPGPALPVAALHLLARRSPDGAAEVVLRYLPFADDAFVEEEAFEALAAVALRGGKADAVVSRALTDKLPLRRAAAARAIGRARDAEVRAPVRKLLEDVNGRVRLEAAQALVLAREKEAVPALFDLLRDDSAEVSGRAESLLFQIAGDKPPEGSAGDGSAAARLKWRDTWATWWKTNGKGIDLAKVGETERKLGLVLVAETSGGQRVWEYGRDGKELWAVSGYSWAMDVRILPGGNVLVADSSDQGVTERDKSGKIVWQRKTDALAAQRLPNGNTFICQHAQIVEVDRAGREVAKHAPGGDTITDAVRLPNGHVVYITVRGMLKEITWPGAREVKTLRLSEAAPNGSDWYRIEEAPGGHYLLASHTDGRAFEIDAFGKVVWEHKVEQAYSATRLANGNVLIATAESRRLVEVDRQHKVIAERQTKGYMGRVRAR
jgi:HEAT repeat protein